MCRFKQTPQCLCQLDPRLENLRQTARYHKRPIQERSAPFRWAIDILDFEIRAKQLGEWISASGVTPFINLRMRPMDFRNAGHKDGRLLPAESTLQKRREIE